MDDLMTSTNQLLPAPAPAVLPARFYMPTSEAAECARDFFSICSSDVAVD
jgi:hypothetical protein